MNQLPHCGILRPAIMNSLSTELFGHLPEHAALVIPSRVDQHVVAELGRALGGLERIVWLYEKNLSPSASVQNYLQAQQATGVSFDMQTVAKEQVLKYVRQCLSAGYHVVLMSPSQEGSIAATDIPMGFLRMFDETTLSVVPVAVSMYNNSVQNARVSAAPYGRLALHFLPEEAAGTHLAERVYAAWAEADAQFIAQHPMVEGCTVARLLLESLMAHPYAQIIDGVDDSHMPYRRILTYSLLLAGKLQHMANLSSIGIILPPGKFSVIANIACLFAGITPLNIDYELEEEEFVRLRETSGIDRFITTRQFISKQSNFPWPRSRDIIDIEKILLALSSNAMKMCEMYTRIFSAKRVAAHYLSSASRPDGIALYTTVRGAANELRMVPCTDKALLAAVVQLQSHFAMQQKEASLFALPLYHAESLVPVFLLPLLTGMDVVTYPAVGKGKRINTLISNYSLAHVVLTPHDAGKLFQHASEHQYQTVRHFHLVAGQPSSQLIRDALSLFNLPLESTERVSAFLAPLVIHSHSTMPNADAEQTAAPRYMADGGRLLPGFTVRIMNLGQKTVLNPLTLPGVVRVTAPSVLPALLSEKDAADNCYSLGYFGRMTDAGTLQALGSLDRFSMVNGFIVSHDEAEAFYRNFMHVSSDETERRLALIGLEDPSAGGHCLVLLTSVYKTVTERDRSDVMRDLRNKKLPLQWAPRYIFPVNSIPVQEDGTVCYDLCRRWIINQLSNR